MQKMGSTPVRAATANRKFRVFLTISWTDGDERTAPRQIVAKFEQRVRCSPHAVIRVHDSAGNVIEAHKHAAELKKSYNGSSRGVSRSWAEINFPQIRFIGY